MTFLLPLIALLLLATCAQATAGGLQLSFTIWNWSGQWRDFAEFSKRVSQCKAAGIDTIEVGMGWRDVEVKPGVYDWTEVDRRVDEVVRQGLQVRFRVNFTYADNWPSWLDVTLMQAPGGEQIGRVLSPFDERVNRLRERFALEAAKHYAGRGFEWIGGLGMHLEVKYGAWISYERPAVIAFQKYLERRYKTVDALNAEAGTAYKAFREIVPPQPSATGDEPDLDPMTLLFIQLREDQLARLADRFADAIRKGDPSGELFVMLGESWRRESAAFSNLAYWRYARKVDRVLHSYDFFMNSPERPENAYASIRFFGGITNKPVQLEIDGPIIFSEAFKWTPEAIVAVTHSAIEAGSEGFNITNNEDDPNKLGYMKGVAELVRESRRPDRALPSENLFYVSKWTFYTLRQSDERLRERIYAQLRDLEKKHGRFRVVSDENLIFEKDLKCRVLAVSYSPVRSQKSQKALLELADKAERVVVDGKPLSNWQAPPLDLDYGL